MSLTPRAAQRPSGNERDRAAVLERLFDEAYDGIVRYCAVRTGSSAVAEDIAAATFVDAARRVADEECVEIDVRWLFMVARRRLIDHWRSAERHRRRLRRIVAWRSASGVNDEVGANRSTALVQEALATLPDRQRALLTLRYLDGYSVTEIGDELGLTYRAAESALARARKSFVESWEELQ